MTLSRARQNQIANQKAVSTDQVGQVDTSGTGNLDLVNEQYDDVLTEDIGLGADDRAESEEAPANPLDTSSLDSRITDVEDAVGGLDTRVTALEEAPAPEGGANLETFSFLIGGNDDLAFNGLRQIDILDLTGLVPGYANPSWAAVGTNTITLLEEGLYYFQIPVLQIRNLTADNVFNVEAFFSLDGSSDPQSAPHRTGGLTAIVGNVAYAPFHRLYTVSDGGSIEPEEDLQLRVSVVQTGSDTDYRVGQQACIVSKLG